MNSESAAHMSKKIRTLVGFGAAILLAGIALHWAAEPLGKEVISRSEHGVVSMIDENRVNSIQFVGDKISWLGLGLIVTGALGWVNRCYE
jgi:hypothetical protein